MKSKRAFLVEAGRFELKEVDVNPKSDEILVKVASCGLCNWELNHWKGYIGECPQTLGHEWAGEVVAIGSDVKNVSIGDKVTALPGSPGFTEYTVLKAEECLVLGPKVNPKYALAEPLKCVTTVLTASSPAPGDYGVVLGIGPMGLWCIQALSGNLLSSLIAVDINDERLELAKKYGADVTINSRTQDADKVLMEVTKGNLADFVIEGTGIPKLLDTGMDYLKSSHRGRLIMMSSHEEPAEKLDFRKAMNKCIELRVAHPGYSHDQADDMRRAVNLLNQGTFKVEELVTHEFKLDDIQKAFETLENKSADYLKGIVVP